MPDSRSGSTTAIAAISPMPPAPRRHCPAGVPDRSAGKRPALRRSLRSMARRVEMRLAAHVRRTDAPVVISRYADHTDRTRRENRFGRFPASPGARLALGPRPASTGAARAASTRRVGTSAARLERSPPSAAHQDGAGDHRSAGKRRSHSGQGTAIREQRSRYEITNNWQLGTDNWLLATGY